MLDLGLAGQCGLGFGHTNTRLAETQEPALDGTGDRSLFGPGHHLELRERARELRLGGVDGGFAVRQNFERARHGLGPRIGTHSAPPRAAARCKRRERLANGGRHIRTSNETAMVL